MSNDLTILCRINSRDEIIFFDEETCRLAVSADIAKLSENEILNHSFWDFITNKTKSYLFRELLQNVRSGKTLRFNIRKNTLDSYYLLELIITPQINEEIQFEIRQLSGQGQPLQVAAIKNILQDDEMLIVCSWCNRINTDKDEWLEVEKAINILKLFERESLPNLSHGMCNECYQVMCAKLFETKK